MKRISRFATLGAILVALPTLLGSNAAADAHVGLPGVQSDMLGGCKETSGSWLESGQVAVISRGYFPAQGTWIDGCGGKGCDDSAFGHIRNSLGEYYWFEISEVRNSRGECRYNCWIETSTGVLEKRGVKGDLDIDAHEDAVWFSCGVKDDGSWIYNGMIYQKWGYDGGALASLPDAQTQA